MVSGIRHSMSSRRAIAGVLRNFRSVLKVSVLGYRFLVLGIHTGLHEQGPLLRFGVLAQTVWGGSKRVQSLFVVSFPVVRTLRGRPQSEHMRYS